ncbi:MAG: DHHA1 domain-containing protein [Nanoarchaeota archaeon]
MLKDSELKQIREFLEKSQNPLFFFDNDADGLCSFLILQRALGRGKGVAIKSFPDLNKTYLRKIEELNPDFVFILDKAKVSREFLEGVNEKSIPTVWIDHHLEIIEEDILNKIEYYNSSPSSEPVTYIAYKIFPRKQDMWLAMIGCIGDSFMPEFAREFEKNYPEFFNSKLSASDSLFTTELGKIVKILNFGLKDTTTNVVNLVKYLTRANNIYDILEENKSTRQLYYRFNQLNKIYENLIKKAESFSKSSKLLFFTYSGEMSMSCEISNELAFRHKNKIIAVAFKKQEKANVSIRGKNARSLTLKALEGIENSSGGGHEQACGAQVPIDKLDEFKENLIRLLGN